MQRFCFFVDLLNVYFVGNKKMFAFVSFLRKEISYLFSVSVDHLRKRSDHFEKEKEWSILDREDYSTYLTDIFLWLFQYNQGKSIIFFSKKHLKYEPKESNNGKRKQKKPKESKKKISKEMGIFIRRVPKCSKAIGSLKSQLELQTLN